MEHAAAELCAEEHEKILDEQQKILSAVSKVEKGLEFHIGQVHSTVSTESVSMLELKVEEIDDKVGKLSEQMTYVADVVLGEAKLNPIDGTITRSGGMKALVDAHQDGGLRLKVPKWLVSIIIALIAMVGTLGGAMIEHSNTNTAQIEQVVEHVMQIQDAEQVGQ